MSDTYFPFEILEIPAAGAFSTLCVARAANGEVVACKVLKKTLVRNAEALTRMRDEARMLSRLEHDGIVKVHDLLNLDGRPVMVMEWVQGLDLSSLLRNHKEGLPGPVAVEIVRQTAQALHVALTRPVGDGGKPLAIIHRDIKPENILLNCEGRVKVLDFGTAKGEFEDRESMTTAMVMGSRGYTAPERMELLEVTAAVDVYALGLSFIELLTGRLPPITRHHERHDPAVQKIMEFIKPKDLPKDRVERIRDLILWMCKYEYEERPSHAEVIAALNLITLGIDVEMAAFARSHVLPIHEERARTPPEVHSDYADLIFLGTAGSWETLGNPDVTEEKSDSSLRDFLKRPGWEKRREDLQLLLTDSARWTSGPFVEVLHGASTPWWQVWQKRPSPQAIALALEFLKRRKDPSVLVFAEQFVNHPDKRVRLAAKALIDE